CTSGASGPTEIGRQVTRPGQLPAVPAHDPRTPTATCFVSRAGRRCGPLRPAAPRRPDPATDKENRDAAWTDPKPRGRCWRPIAAPAAGWAGRTGVMAMDVAVVSTSVPARMRVLLAGEWRRVGPAQRFACLVGCALMLAGVAHLAAWLVVGGAWQGPVSFR